MTDRRFTLQIDEARLDALFAELDSSQFPGITVGIAAGGGPVYRKGFGLAHMELPLVLTPSTRMRIYSTSKHFACLAYMLLCEEGLADPADPIGRVLPELPPAMHPVTIEQLMLHISGLRDAHGLLWQFSGTVLPLSSEDVLATYREITDVNFAPGSGWCYNNGAYTLLSFAIERIAGADLETVLRERIFAPVGMHDTLLRRSDTGFVPNSATMHMRDAGGTFSRSTLGSETAGEGGIVSTADDMLRWLAHMDRPIVGDASTWRRMTSPHVMPGGVSTDYALGLIRSTYRGVETLYHAGGGLGANCQMLKVPPLGLDLVIMSNRHDVLATELANQVLDSCIAGLDPNCESDPSGPTVTGVYRSSSGRIVEMGACEGVQIATIDGWPIPMAWDRKERLRPTIVTQFKKEILAPQGLVSPSHLDLDEFGVVERFDRIEEDGDAEWAVLSGDYVCETVPVRISLDVGEAGGRMMAVGKFGSIPYLVEVIAPRILRVTSSKALPDTAILSFDDLGNIRFFSSTNLGLVFRKAGSSVAPFRSAFRLEEHMA